MELLQLAIVGGIISAVVGLIKTKFGTHGWKTIISLAVISAVAGWGYWFLKGANLIETSVTILVASNTVYTLLLKQLQGK